MLLFKVVEHNFRYLCNVTFVSFTFPSKTLILWWAKLAVGEIRTQISTFCSLISLTYVPWPWQHE